MRRQLVLVLSVWVLLTVAMPSSSQPFELISQELKVEVVVKKKDLLKKLKDIEEGLFAQEARVGEASKGCGKDLDSQTRQAQPEFDRLDDLRARKRALKAELNDLELFVKANNAGRTPKWWFARSRLFVNTKPENAEVKILNIDPKFIQGVELEPGEYLLEVSAPGYRAKRIKLDMPRDYKEIAVELVRP